jgi:RNA ligase (TIGR02306 family)
VDSWVPHDLAPFLSKGKEPREFNGIKGERLRTVRLRGQISQGLILPLWGSNMLVQKFATCETVGNRPYPVWVENITDYGWYVMPDGRCVEGALFELDVSEPLGIIKYEPPIPACLAGVVKGAFPSCFPKTDEERCQNLTDSWNTLQQYQYEVTEKVEGSSMSVGLVPADDSDEFIVCSRNLNLTETEGNTLWKLARKLDLENKLRAIGHPGGVIVQGEIIGPGIQGNYYGVTDHQFYVFAVYSVGDGRYYTPVSRRELCKSLDILHTPVITTDGSIAGMTIGDVLAAADGKSIINPSKRREGLVYKRADGTGGQEHFKAVSNEYLLKTDG